MTITYNNENYEFNDDICRAYEQTLGLPLTTSDMKMYLRSYTHQDPEISLRTLSSKDVVYIVEKCIEDEFVTLYGQELWDKYVK